MALSQKNYFPAAAQGASVSVQGLVDIFAGTGAPTFSATKASLYLRQDGSSTSTRMYVNTDGAATWTAVTTVA
jgi:hypothetical protein